MQKLFMSFFDVLFPPSEDMLLVRKASKENLISLVREQNHNGIISLTNYQNEIIRALIHESKFHGSKQAQTLLASLFDSYVKNHLDSFDYVVPIPLSPQRKRERGFNQVEEVLQESTHRRNFSLYPKLLHRKKNTAPQTSLEKSERIENMQNVFSVTKPKLVTNKHILVVDDVTTTGATLRSAQKELMKHKPASVTLLALAH